MKTVLVHLALPENVKDFVNVVSRYPYDIDLRSGRHVVDAKSILGIFSLDLSKPITMEIFEENCDDLLAAVESFKA
ncbi:MAG: HPr family phosphocarrier protein [Christensenellaceae bacterium]|jgi:phosphotransferase system HPr-like phosphotransfer protein|nr:HPr family phosphocarrier protein [Christensenellaceae bacterium]